METTAGTKGIGTVVTCNLNDSIMVAGGNGTAFQSPVQYLLDVQAVMHDAMITGCKVTISKRADKKWYGTCGGCIGKGDTPWGAMIALANSVRNF